MQGDVKKLWNTRKEQKFHNSNNIVCCKIGKLREKNRKYSIFHKNKSFLAINKLRLSAYLCTPSGNPKLALWLSLSIPKLFSYPPRQKGLFKKSVDYLNSPFIIRRLHRILLIIFSLLNL